MNNTLAMIRERVVTPFLFILFSLLLWELCVRYFQIKPYLVPSPVRVLETMDEFRTVLSHDFIVTLSESALGLVLGASVGFLVAVCIVHSRFAELMLQPILVASQAIPIVAVAPLLIIWFGHGLGGKVIMSAIICFFPTTVNAINGLVTISPEALNFMRTLRATSWKIFLLLRLPSSLRSVLVGLKTSAALSVIGAIVAELAGASQGLGFRIVIASSKSETPLVFAALVLASLLGIAMYYGVNLAAHLLLQRLGLNHLIHSD